MQSCQMGWKYCIFFLFSLFFMQTSLNFEFNLRLSGRKKYKHSHMQNSLQVITGLIEQNHFPSQKIIPIQRSITLQFHTKLGLLLAYVPQILMLTLYIGICQYSIQCNDYYIRLSVFQRIPFLCIHGTEYFHKCKITYIYIHEHV